MEDSLSRKKDEEIVSLVQSDRVELFGVLMQRYEAKIKRYARKFFSNKEDINDVVQEVFIKAYKNIESFDTKKKFSPWLYRIAHNEFINALKKKKVVLPLLDLDTFFPHFNKPEDIREKIDRKIDYELIEKCLDGLDFKYREAIVLHYFEGMSYREIAEVMQIPVSTVGIRIKRAKESIKSICEKIGYKYGTK
jgi:RNA polymerase sigma-70 factor (ECF subfamily)